MMGHKKGADSVRTNAFLYFQIKECKNKKLLLFAVAITAHELINATGGVNELLLAGEEWVRRVGDFKLNQWVSYTVDFDCFL